MIAEAIRRLIDGEDLSRDQMQEVFDEMMSDQASDAQKSALLIALKIKGESVDEVTGAALAMRARVARLETSPERLIDTCGTGGDGRGTFNISTVGAIVAASAGARVAKHGNRAISSKCGSADLLKAMGVGIEIESERAAGVLDRAGIVFLFAPCFHPAMKAVAHIRRDLGVRTVFNILGPLTNPAFTPRQVLGVYAGSLRELVAGVLRELGAEHAMVVHSRDGMDEISISAPTDVSEVRDGEIRSYSVTPEELGVMPHSAESYFGYDAPGNAEIAHRLLEGEAGAYREVVLANSGAALYVSGVAATIREGVERAREAIDSGRAAETLQQLIALTRSKEAEP